MCDFTCHFVYDLWFLHLKTEPVSLLGPDMTEIHVTPAEIRCINHPICLFHTRPKGQKSQKA